jgi:hypothetical protein
MDKIYTKAKRNVNKKKYPAFLKYVCFVMFQVLTAVSTKMAVFWVVGAV